jgi:hypothetical protein
MSIEQAKEVAAIAAVNEHITRVNQRTELIEISFVSHFEISSRMFIESASALVQPLFRLLNA